MKTKNAYILIVAILGITILYGSINVGPISEPKYTDPSETIPVTDGSTETPTTGLPDNQSNTEDSESDDLGFTNLNPNRDLSNYTITYENVEYPALKAIPALTMEKVDLDEEKASLMLSKIFNFSESKTSDMPWGGISYTDSGERVEFFGLNQMYYDNLDEKPVIKEWNEASVLKTANDFVEKVMTYYDFDTEVSYELRSVGPCYYTTEYNPETEEKTLTIHAIGVYYTLEVDGYSLSGSGADMSVWVANGEVVNAEIHYPKISIAGTMDVVYSADQAVEKFILGEHENTFYQDLRGPIAKTGECTIKSVDIIYYVNFADSVDAELPARYRIQGILKYIDPIEKDLVEEEFTEYLLIN